MLPIVSILDTTSSAVVSQGGKNALVLGTPVTMKSSVYPDVLAKHGVQALPQLDEEEIQELSRLIDVDLYQGRCDVARKRMLEISHKYISNRDTDIVCLACTELPLAFPEYADAAYFEIDGIGFINTIAAHVSAAISESLNA